MKLSKLTRLLVAIASAIILIEQAAAQPTAPTGVLTTIPAVPGAERFLNPAQNHAQREWMRGYRTGYQHAFWIALNDRRAGLHFVPPFFAPHNSVRMSPYRHGFNVGYVDGYRRGFLHTR